MNESQLGSDGPFYESKVAVYAEAENPVVLAQVLACLPGGGRVLDVGCGSGVLLAHLAGYAGYRAGLELSATAAAAAALVADEVANVAVGDPLSFPPATFDVVVCADILEHLPDPAAGLAFAARYCRPGGAIVISVPNVAYWQARLRLARGVWRYEPTGLFDSGHLRFLTKSSLLELIGACGLDVVLCEPAELPELAPHIAGRLPRPLRPAARWAWRAVGNRLATRRPTLFAYQFVCTVRRPSAGAV